MGERIVIHPVTRIEGHAKVSIYVDDAGEVSSAQFHVTEFRGFEKLCEGRPFHEMPGLMSRICGICPVSHVIASSKAGDALLGVEVPEPARKLRMLVNYAQLLQSHALSFFHLSAPYLLLGMDAPPESRSIFGLMEHDLEFTRRGIRLRQFGQRIIEMAGGKKIHPAWGVPGGVNQALTGEERDEILSWPPEAYESISSALSRLKPILDTMPEEVEHIGNFPTLFLGTVSDEGKLEYYSGVIRIADSEGNVVADELDPHRYATFLGEASEEWSFMKFPFYKPLGYPGGKYRVGPLARLNVASSAGTSRADRELREFKQRAKGAVCQSFHYHLARLIEMLHAVEKIEELAGDPDLLSHEIRAKAGLNRRVGIGSCEAPRGTLFHQYEVDSSGLVRKANLLIATAQNNLALNQAVEQTARYFVTPRSLQEGMLNRVEAAIRCFDPCLSCSTHAIGQMPLSIELRNSSGELIHRLERNSPLNGMSPFSPVIRAAASARGGKGSRGC
jgi:NAD-reducing hydrogenase large subunit